jgi:hypothetical protein
LLIIAMTLLGVGGFFWHLLDADWARWADRSAMLAFVNLFLMSFLYRGARVDGFTVILMLLGFQWLLVTVSDSLAFVLPNGAALHVAALIMLAVVFLFATRSPAARARLLFGAFVIFGTGIVLKAADLSLCPTWPPGTHFLWHLLSSVGFYLAFMGLVSFLRPPNPVPSERMSA